MNADLLRRSTQLAEAGRLDEAETLLVEACDPAMLRFQLGSMSAVAAYRPRDQLLRLAVEDHEAERYHAVVPVVLAQIDGLVAEIIGAAPFHRTKDVLGKLVAWDSISAQTGGLPDLISLMASPRFETTTGPLDVPYRHGILHGRDLGYAHKKVAAKTWAALFSLREWALKYQHGEHEPPPVEPAPSVLATLRQIADAERQRKAIEAWRPRTGLGALAKGAGPIHGTPEAALVTWLDAWRTREFLRMASFTQASMRRRDPNMAARLEETFGYRQVAGSLVTGIEDVAAAMTKVTVEIHFAGEDPPVSMTANVLYEAEDGYPLVRGTTGGIWRVNDISAGSAPNSTTRRRRRPGRLNSDATASSDYALTYSSRSS